jgi:hypothetical protein
LTEAETQPVIVATEVVDLLFAYLDPSTLEWMPSWDGTLSGPPAAVRITMTIQPPAETSVLGLANRPPTTYTRVVAIPGASIPQEVINQEAGVTTTGATTQ